MTDENSERPRRSRQLSTAALAGRQAAAFVRELNRQLGLWQASSVKLQTMAERVRSAGRHDPQVSVEIRTLFSAVKSEAQRFEESLARQSPEVAEHGRVRDTRRSFDMISGRLRQSLRLLGEHEGDE
jgi:hypothetical protein